MLYLLKWRRIVPYIQIELKRAELAISGIAQTWHDIAYIVETFIECRDINVNIRVRLRQFEQAIRGSDDTDIGQTGDTTPFENIDRVNCRTSSCQHGPYCVGHLQINFVWQLS